MLKHHILIAALTGMLIVSAQATPADDHINSRAALLAGEIMPLRTILDKVEKQYPGRVLEVELDRSKGNWVYEMKLLREDGRLVKLLVDAKDGSVLGEKVRTPKHKMKNMNKGEHENFNHRR
ncbi:MAG: PepSY domain-containing protein [Venatoribacter sp.]